MSYVQDQLGREQILIANNWVNNLTTQLKGIELKVQYIGEHTTIEQ